MASNTPLVPSKNALRALRRLAFSPSSIAVGALGSVCGVATFNYETRRRVHLAEQIVETKRVLRAVSSGTATARLSDMFEAAERGEDFTLQAQHARQRRRKIGTRSLTTAASPVQVEENDIAPRETVSKADQQFRHFQIQHVYARARGPSFPEQTVGAGIHSKAVERVLAASKEANKTSSHPVYGRPLRHDRPRRSLPGGVERRSSSDVWHGEEETPNASRLPASSRTSSSQHQQGMDQTNPTIDAAQEASNSNLSTPINQETGFNQPKQTNREPLSRHKDSSHDLPTDSGRDKPVLERPIIENSKPTWKGSKSIAPATLPNNSSDFSLGSEQPSHDLKNYLSSLQTEETRRPAWRTRDLYKFVPSGNQDAADQALRKHLDNAERAEGDSVRSTILDDIALIPREIRDQLKESMDLRTFATMKSFILPHSKPLNARERFRRWSAVMRHCTRDSQPDWAMAEAVYYKFRFCFGADGILTQPAFEVVNHLLTAASGYDRAQEILFPSLTAVMDESASLYELPSNYLGLFCAQNDGTAGIREMEKVIAIAKRAGRTPSKDLFVPVLRATARSGNIDQAYDLMDSLETLYGKDEAPRIWSEYAMWHAAYGSWEEVQTMLDRLHEIGYTRQQSVNYALLFHKLLLQYMTQNSAVRSFGFTIHAIKYTGLHPLGMISTTMICSCIKEQRYDLVTEWIRLIREAFPRVTLGFENGKAAWQLGHALMEAGASCQDIAETCRAITHGCRDTPFSPLFKDFAKDLVRRDMVERYRVASRQMIGSTPSEDVIVVMPLDELIDHAYQLCALPQTPDCIDIRFEGLQHDLAAQLHAVEELTSIFKGDIDVANVFGHDNYEAGMLPQTRHNSGVEQNLDGLIKVEWMVPENLRRKILPEFEELSATVVNYYARREKENLPVDHSMLKYLLGRLSLDKSQDALRLVEMTYWSSYVQGARGKPYDNDVFLKWLELVTEIGTVPSAVRALWAVVDSSRHLQWTFDFTYLVNLVCHMNVSGNHASVSKANYWRPNRSLNHLVKSIWRIRHDSPEYIQDRFEFPEWHDWELRLRESLQNRPTGSH